MKIPTLIFVIFSVYILSLLLPTVQAVCCGATVACPAARLHFLYCSDCYPKDSFGCCGNGKCNIFCCDCDNGCRSSCNARCVSDTGTCQCSPSRQSDDDIEKEYRETLAGRRYVKTIDGSDDWKIDFDEFTDFIIARFEEHLARHNESTIVVTPVLDAVKMRFEFDKLDKDRSGYLEFSEIDASLE